MARARSPAPNGAARWAGCCGNWHLKLAAVGLATILYTGFVYSGSFTDQEFSGLPIRAVNQPDGAYPLTQSLGSVNVQFRLAANADRVTDESFSVTVDLSAYDMSRAPQPQALAVEVDSLQDGLQILSYTPTTAAGRARQAGPAVVERGGRRPARFPMAWPSTRPASAPRPSPPAGRRASWAGWRVPWLGCRSSSRGSTCGSRRSSWCRWTWTDKRSQSVELTPATVSVEIDVHAVETSKTVPIRPVLSGTPGTGSEVGSVTVEPAVVTIFGLPRALESVDEIATEPISIAGASQTLTRDATLVLPDGTRTAQGADAPVVSDCHRTVSFQPYVRGGRRLPQRSQRHRLPAGAVPAGVDAARSHEPAGGPRSG